MIRRPLRTVLATAVAAAVLTGCGSPASDDAADPLPGTAAPAAPSPTPSGNPAVGGSVRDAGDVPDPCTLLSDAQVKDLTGRGITRTDRDGADDGADVRYCQWQQPSGQLAVFLSRVTPGEFATVVTGATPVQGVGERAFALAGHLYVLYGTVQVDVYARGDSDEENLRKATRVVDVLLPRI